MRPKKRSDGGYFISAILLLGIIMIIITIKPTPIARFALLALFVLIVIFTLFGREFSVKSATYYGAKKSDKPDARDKVSPKVQRGILLRLLILVDKRGSLTLDVAAAELRVDKYMLEDFLKPLEDRGCISLYYSAQDNPVIKKADEKKFRALLQKIKNKSKTPNTDTSELEDQFRSMRKNRYK